MLDVSDLSMIETIYETGSLTQASEKLHVSQPTLSKRLARLEQQLNAKLFHRNPTGLAPTLIATYLIESAERIKANVASVERQVERLLQHDQGELRVGVGPIIEQVLIPPVLTEFAQKTGNVKLSVVTDRAEVLLQQLLAGQLDVIAGPYAADTPSYSNDGITAIELIQEQTINVARVGHPIFTPEQQGFFSYPYASPPRQGTMLGVERPKTEERARVHADNYTLLKTLVLSSDYICGGPRYIFAQELQQGTLKVIEDSPCVSWQSACLFQTHALETPLVKLFTEIMVKQRDRYLEGRQSSIAI